MIIFDGFKFPRISLYFNYVNKVYDVISRLTAIPIIIKDNSGLNPVFVELDDIYIIR